ncbi:MAG TPA: MFS transporter [Vicinamibacterales bacterium]|jgi:MFS family permease|nr:MFS transporter [Vicinamibacterales bacterium]
MQRTETTTGQGLTATEWLICIIAAIGFAFDTYELLMLPLIVGPALGELVHARVGTPEYASWVGVLFFVPAVFGGIFGLLGGYLTDRLGRRRVLTWSILLYAFSALGAGYATNIYWLLALRCTTFIGVCVEFVAATAWLAELFAAEPKQRERVLGYTQAFGSVGGVMVTWVYYFCVQHAASFPAIHGGHAAWRYTLISGLIPAVPLIVIRPFLPESPIWKEKKAAGTLRRPSLGELFAPAYAKTTIVTTIMFACAYGAAFGAIQHMPRIVPGMPEVASLAPPVRQQIASVVQSYQEYGGLIGRILLAILAVRIVSRRSLLWVFQIPGLFVVPIVFYLSADSSLTFAKLGMFLAGLFTVSQFSFWGNYLPRMYPTYLRGTGESFAANVGGRMIGTFAAWVTPQLATSMPGSPTHQLAYAAALVGLVVYVGGVIASFQLQEPTQEELPE